jgi:topoisomerase IA-like protein
MNIRMSGLAIAVLALTSSAAFAETELTPETKAKIEDMLKAQGYEVGKIKVEDGNYEAYVKKGGEKMELILNDKLEIIKTEND